jgi:hypothetical protein
VNLRAVVVGTALAAASLHVTPARACGPDFAATLLDDRRATLLGLPDGSFLLEATRFVPRPALPFVAGDGDATTRAAATTAMGRRYDDGVAAFGRGENAVAIGHFRAVVDAGITGADPTRERAAHAAFMLGRLERGAAGLTPVENRWARVRSLVQAGAPDGEGLAVASYGEEARDALEDGDDVKAIGLYAQQAALGGSSGALSLLFVARAVIADEARLRRVLADPVGQRLVTTFLWTRGVEAGVAPSPWDDDEKDAAAPRSTPLLEQVLGLAKQGGIAGADALAASLYRAGRVDDARLVLARADDTALAAWLRSRLAVRAGDRAGADLALVAALDKMSPQERWPAFDGDDYSPRARLIGERATLALADGRFDDAARLLLEVRHDYWHDLAIVLERVLTVEQLRAVVDHASATLKEPPAPPACRGDDDDAADCVWGGPEGTLRDLRALVGRRLLRHGQLDAALAYFDGADADAARAFVTLKREASDLNGVDRAERLWTAATTMRRQGMEIAGTEVGPDWDEVEGAYDRGEDLWWRLFPDGPWFRNSWVPSPRPDVMVLRLQQPENAAFVSAAELEACRRHAPQPPLRFHYRHVAALLAEEAASSVPPRSQAFAALLCAATKWTPDPQAHEAFYRRYISEGALVDFAGTFGASCPAPDFAKARIPPPKKPLQVRKRDVVIVLAAVAMVAVGVVSVLRRRRMKY